MKKMIKCNNEASLEAEAHRVYSIFKTYPDVDALSYVDETESYVISFDEDADVLNWIPDAIERAGYTLAETTEDASIYKSADNKFRGWLYDDEEVEFYITL